MSQEEGCSFSPVAGVDFGVNVGNVTLHRPLAQDQIISYLAVGLSFRYEMQDFYLTPG
jgi:hypothetical protein